MTLHRYPRHDIVACYRRAAIGTALTAGPVVAGKPVLFLTLLLSALAAVFLVYGLTAFVRGRTVFEVSDQGIEARGPRPRKIAWQDLTDLSLSYYATKSDRENGWMQLKLNGGGHAIKLESTLEQFDTIVARVIGVARQRGMELSPTTLENLRPLGLATEAAAPCPTS